MEPLHKIRVSMANGKLDVEGTDQFISKYEAGIRGLLGRLKEQPMPIRTPEILMGQQVLTGVARNELIGTERISLRALQECRP